MTEPARLKDVGAGDVATPGNGPTADRTFEQMPLPGIEPAGLPRPVPPADPELPAGKLRDPRQMAFAFVGRGVPPLLRLSFPRSRLATARAVYDALVELASEARSSEFRASREQVAERAKVVVRTVVRYTKKFEAIGLLEVVRPRGGRNHPVNTWRLLQVAGDLRRVPADTPSDYGGDSRVTPAVKKKNGQEGGNVLPFDRSRPKGARPDPYAVER